MQVYKKVGLSDIFPCRKELIFTSTAFQLASDLE